MATKKLDFGKKVKHRDFGYREIEGTPEPVPLELPPFTLKQIRDSIPKHCFERCLVTSVKYLIKNVATCAILFYMATFFKYFPLPLQFILWPLYWMLQTIYLAGIWVIAHECGHGAFSEYPKVNDAVGLVLHSSLLVPYHSWKLSHHKHHQNSGSCENDEVFVPAIRSHVASETVEFLEDSPIYRFVVTLLIFFSWMPGYLIYNFSGPLKNRNVIYNDPDKTLSHFSPKNPIFLAKQKDQIILSDAGFLVGLAALVYCSISYGFFQVYLIYIIPYWALSFALIFVTYLHHTDSYIPHYRSKEWNWLRGALCTVDRSFGSWMDDAVHHISDTHVCHHLFPTIPFYHAVEATEAMKGVLGKYYLKDDTNVVRAFRRLMRNCRFVEDEGDIVFYKKSLKDLD